MIKNEFVAKKGFEDVFDLVVAKKEAYEIDLENAKAEAIAEVEKSFEERKEIIDEMFSKASVLVQVEIPDEELEEELEETELRNETIVVD